MNLTRRFPVLADVGLLIGRLALGVVFIAHGWQKFRDAGLSTQTEMFDGMGIPMPGLAAFLVTWVELLGGIALILGLLTRLVGILLALDMLGAWWFVHRGEGLFVSDGGYELVLVLGATALLLAFTGAGRISLDGAIFGRGRAADREREEVRA